jgi:hypothetical protein
MFLGSQSRQMYIRAFLGFEENMDLTISRTKLLKDDLVKAK